VSAKLISKRSKTSTLPRSFQLRVGIHADAGTELLENASRHEFGWTQPSGVRVEARSFIRSWFDEKQDEILTLLRKNLHRPEALALVFAGGVQKWISQKGPRQELSERTLDAKAPKSTALINSGALRQSIAGKVVFSEK
jgi:hypothetical protein